MFGHFLELVQECPEDDGAAPAHFSAAQCFSALAHFDRCTKHIMTRLQGLTLAAMEEPLHYSRGNTTARSVLQLDSIRC
jgi:hypothetical protein